MSLFRKPALLGLDVGSSTVKAVQLRKKGKEIFAERTGIAAMPSGAISGGMVLDPPAVSNCIRKLCENQRLGERRVAVALGGDGVFLTRLKLNPGPADALPDRIREETARQSPFLLQQAALDFQILNHSPSDSSDTPDTPWDVLVVAARPEKIEGMREVLRRAGKTAVLVDSCTCALANTLEFNHRPAASEISVLLHLGAAAMSVVILRGSVPLLAQEFPLVPPASSDETWNPAQRVAVQLERMFEQMDEIADEHPLEPGSRQIQRIWLSGGGSRMRGLEEVLRDRIKLPLQEINPFRKIEFRSAEALDRVVWDHAHCMTVAVGLALRNFQQL